MPWHEIAANLHMHTPYSDGAWYHARIAEAAMRAGLDLIIVTDHNVWVDGPERYYEQDGRRVLLLVGEEIHDQARQPQKNHMLIYGAGCELARHAPEPQALIDAARAAQGLAFLAHPVDASAPLFHEVDLSWVNWEVTGFTGLEIWNFMTEFKSLLTSRSNALRYALNPETGIRGPFPAALARWDELTAAGQRIVAIGNADAHGSEYRLGGLRRTIFPYEHLFRAVNTHLLLEAPLSGDAGTDRRAALEALARGHCFVGYDLPAPTRGFRFSASSLRGPAIMGDEIHNRDGITFQIAAPLALASHSPSAASVGQAASGTARFRDRPARASLRLIRNGQEVGRWDDQTHATYIVPAGQTGAYRVEAHLAFQGQMRGWIFSNPIYVR